VKSMLVKQFTIDQLAQEIPDGSKIALPPDYAYCSLATVRALIRKESKRLHLVGVPSLGFQADMLIGAGCVETVETAAVTLSEYGLAPRFTSAVKRGSIRMMDATCPAIHAALQASEKGIPFIPLRGLIGSDILKNRTDWKVEKNPFAENDPIVLLPALRPDIALIHAPIGDKFGNVWVGVRREQMLMAHASRKTYVTVEEIVDGNIMEDAKMKAGAIPGIYVNGIAEAKNGALPIGIPGGYDSDREHLRRYVELAQTDAGFRQYVVEFVYESPAEAAE